MRATVLRRGQLLVDEVPDPTPGPGQMLVRTLACGICGSDLHFLQHGDQMEALMREGAEMPGAMVGDVLDLQRDLVLGHEFSAEVVELGPDCPNRKVGDVVVSMPALISPAGVHMLGYSNAFPGGYGEQMVLNDMLSMPVPNGLDPHHAALTEPMAVGLHAVNRGRVKAGTGAVVLGCGPVGLAVIGALAHAGAEPIVAADLSPARRALATTMGAHEVVDPRDEPALDAWNRLHPAHTPTIFEAVGVPGMLDAAMSAAPRGSRIVVVGVCMEPDTIRPLGAVVRELDVAFAFAYDPMEFAETLRRIAEGELDVAPLVTGTTGLDGVAQAFTDLASPETHCKILVTP